MKASINSLLAWLSAERYKSRPPRGVTRRWLSGGVPPGGDRSPEGATGTGWGAVSGDQAELPGPRGGLGAVGGAELAQEVGDVLLDRVERHHQVVGDATVGQARGGQPQHLQLAQVARRPLPPARSLLATGRSPPLSQSFTWDGQFRPVGIPCPGPGGWRAAGPGVC